MKSIITEFSILGLFSEYNIAVKFHDNVKIIVGENGIGKTTILNMLYYTIAKEPQEFLRLKEYDFKAINIQFSSGTNVEFTKEALINYVDGPRLPLEVRRLQRILEKNEIMDIIEKVKSGKDITKDEKYEWLVSQYNIDLLKINLKVLSDKYMLSWEIDDARKKILNEINGEVIYLPTYRRVEEESFNFEKDIQSRNRMSMINGKIGFGLQDVQNRIDKITADIKKAYRIGFSKISAEILNDMVDGISVENDQFNSFKKMSIIVDRIDDEILSTDEKERIKVYMKNLNKDNFKNGPYNYFLSKLMKIYNEQAEEEKKIIKFKDICNNYLFNKHFEYDESSIRLIVKENHSDKEVKLNKLSSGEKQIISIFSNLYLDNNKKYIILFDEPELSLSMEWQQKLLPDINNSKKCNLLLAITHSPFIFKNDLAKYAVSLNRYLEAYND